MRKRGHSSLLTGVTLCLSLMSYGRGDAATDHELMLRKLITDAAAGHIDYSSLTPQLAEVVRPQAMIAQSELSALGTLKAVSLSTTQADGTEIYRTAFENGDLDWAFHTDAQGRIDNAVYRKAKPDQR